MIMCFLCTLLAECVLVVRVVAVYPPSRQSLARSVTIYGPVILFKLARVANMTVAAVNMARLTRNSANPIVAGQVVQQVASTRVEWFLQTFDTSWSLACTYLGLHRVTRSLSDSRPICFFSGFGREHSVGTTTRWMSARGQTRGVSPSIRSHRNF